MKSKLCQDVCKNYMNATSSEHERKIVRNATAHLRANMKQDNPDDLPYQVASLIFLSLNGANADFAQIYIINLVSSNRFSYKLIGYMAAQLLIDQFQDLVVLMTQSILKDLESRDKNVINIVLHLIANIGSPDLCKSCAKQVKNLLNYNHPRIKKAAGAAVLHIVKTCPDLASEFTMPLLSMFNLNDHNMLMIGSKLAYEIYPHIPENEDYWLNITYQVLRCATTLLKTNNTSSPYHIAGLENPFLQASLLKCLERIAKPSIELDTYLVDVIQSVELKRAVGRSLVVQATEVIQKVAQKESLRALAINTVAKMLYLEYPTIIYTALSVFCKILYRGNEIINRNSSYTQALSRHRAKIISCLDHRDPFIRRRALEVITALVNGENIESLFPEIMKYVQFADSDFKSSIIFKIFYLVQNFAPSLHWNIDAVLEILHSCGNYVSNEIISKFTEKIGKNQRLQEYALPLLEQLLQDYPENQAIVQVASYLIGEFSYNFNENVLPTMVAIAKMPQTSHETINYILIAIAKYSYRFQIVDESVFNFFESFTKSDNIEIQQRTGELIRILKNPAASDELLVSMVYDEEKDQAITPYASDLSVVLELNKIKSAQSTSSVLISTQDSIKQLLETPVITPPPRSTEVLQTNDLAIYFEVSKNPVNRQQFCIRSSIFNKTSKQLTNFRIKYGVPTGWTSYCKDNEIKNLHPSPVPLQNLVMIESKTNTPLIMKVLLSYSINGENINSIENLKNFNHLL
ncbi:Adaptin N terminal region family protein [Trichomonas vaginalis G3]|uniref:Adaptin N terminal region family protein n=1 Tax=Trichomonas vaginalis (strain ATCC PRA-98 / G3) TaxID=412133 RepID=A2FYZ1_TRIV3|nr:adaptin, alpha/gamma/epsilon family [Trichomonas vaginalis G3]EAX89873.1 Adaptin N terminal region family protein [Trichomonas vaginalis G3]KAI5515312.1 adaptin, alpha/gamma/epsilon family [Trichomonas vaginalis G3]|eukprot:XP_001302803.1 Adaptin N terminal region family protein [Trichomonas vaginalis G3]